VLESKRIRRDEPGPRGRGAARIARWSLALVLLARAAGAEPPPTLDSCDLVPVADPQTVVIETALGTLEIETYSNVAPETVANFRDYIARGDYDDTVVHRVAFAQDGVTPFVIQTGGFRSQGVFFEEVEKGPPIPNEPCISNVLGTVAMAKVSGDPNSATSEWFINQNDNSANLDSQNGGFTAFGQVLGNGLEIAQAISDLEDRVPDAPLPFYLAAVQSQWWSIFLDSPLLGPIDLDGDHGCFDPAQSGLLLVENPTHGADYAPDETLGVDVTVVSTACETGGGGGGAGVGSIPCTAPGRRVIRIDPDTSEPIPDAAAEFGLAEVTLSCEGLAASEASFAVRLADIAAQLDGSFVKLAYSIPEPGASSAGAAALLCLAFLRRSARRRLRSR
jgi:cyclophilin family peptidyl-prolyl cis-trans isomerase